MEQIKNKKEDSFFKDNNNNVKKTFKVITKTIFTIKSDKKELQKSSQEYTK